METRITLSDPTVNVYVTTIEFSMINQSKSIKKGEEIEYLSPAFARVITQNLGSMAKHFVINPKMNALKQLVAFDFKIEILTKEDLTQQDNQSIVSAIQKSLEQVFDKDAANLNLSQQVNVKSEINEEPTAKYKGTVIKRSYKYNQIYKTTAMEIEFLDENEKTITINGSRKIQYQYDRCENVTGISYIYSNYTPPSKNHITSLQATIERYIEDHPDCKQFYFSILMKDYNQALRKACAAGNSDLVNLLFHFDKQGELDIDINQSSLDGTTPLDYALKSGNENLIKLLEINDAETSKSLLLSFADNDRKEIHSKSKKINTNQCNDLMSSVLNRGNFSDSDEDPFDNNNYTKSSHYNIHDEVNRINQINHENQMRIERENARRMEEFNRINQMNRENQMRIERENARRLEEINRLNAQPKRSQFGSYNPSPFGNVNPHSSSFGVTNSFPNSFANSPFIGGYLNRNSGHNGGMNQHTFNQDRDDDADLFLNSYSHNKKF